MAIVVLTARSKIIRIKYYYSARYVGYLNDVLFLASILLCPVSRLQCRLSIVNGRQRFQQGHQLSLVCKIKFGIFIQSFQEFCPKRKQWPESSCNISICIAVNLIWIFALLFKVSSEIALSHRPNPHPLSKYCLAACSTSLLRGNRINLLEHLSCTLIFSVKQIDCHQHSLSNIGRGGHDETWALHMILPMRFFSVIISFFEVLFNSTS